MSRSDSAVVDTGCNRRCAVCELTGRRGMAGKRCCQALLTDILTEEEDERMWSALTGGKSSQQWVEEYEEGHTHPVNKVSMVPADEVTTMPSTKIA